MLKIETVKNEEIVVVSSRVIAQDFEKRHDNIIRDIENLISENSKLSSQVYFIKNYYKVETNNKKYPEYLLTRDGFSLLVMGFTGKKALEWKIRYIEQFNNMEQVIKERLKETKRWEIERAKSIMLRNLLTDTIKIKVEDSKNKQFVYMNYTKLVYKVLFGKTVTELRKDLNISGKANIRNYLTTEELGEVEILENLIVGLINVGWGYSQIKDFIEKNNTKAISC